MSVWDKAKDFGKEAAEKAKQAKKERDSKAADLKDKRGKKLGSVSYGLMYMGGYGSAKKGSGKLTFYEKRTEFVAGFSKEKSFSIDNKDIVDVVIEGRHDVNRRVTATRLLAFGIFAFAAKKKNEEKEAFITIELRDGQEAIFRLTNSSPLEVKTKLSAALGSVKKGKKAPSDSKSYDYTKELAKLAELKEKGILTEEEFSAKKKQILDL